MKTTAILIPTYKRYTDLINTLEKTPIDVRAKFIIVANLEDEELKFIRDKYKHNSIIIDEREYGKLGGSKAYNLAFKIAKDNNFDYAMLFADDVIPFNANWLNKLYKEFINKDGKFGIFISDECHIGHYGWNFILDCPIGHFFIIDCNLVDELFLPVYKQYIIDFEIAVRLQSKGIDIQLLPIKFNHLRSGLHREYMGANYNEDMETFVKFYPKYEASFKQALNLYFLKGSSRPKLVSDINFNNLKQWSELKPKGQSIITRVKRKMLSVMNKLK